MERRDRAIVTAGLAGLSCLAWLYLIYDGTTHLTCRALMRVAPHAWGLTHVALLFAMWAVMMVAMMVPSVSPMVFTFASVNRQRREHARPFVPTWMFLCGYLVAWAVFSALATLGQWALHASALVSSAMVVTSPWVAAALLIAAGLFQFTPLKRACLVHCRTPLTFLMTEWREGWFGAFLMGLRHGAYCVGCCWILMSLLFVAGVMNVFWIAVISLVVLAEKILPAGPGFSRTAGWLLMAGGGTWLVSGALR